MEQIFAWNGPAGRRSAGPGIAVVAGLASVCLLLCVGCEAYQLDPMGVEYQGAGPVDVDAGDGDAAGPADSRLPRDGGSDIGGGDSATDTGACSADADGGCGCNYRGAGRGVCLRGVAGGDGGCGEPDGWESDEQSCDQLDNDCDGVTDEGCPCRYLDRPNGVCENQTVGAEAGTCRKPEEFEKSEVSCDQLDNDCDGVTDEGCPCDYQPGDSGMAVGVCKMAERNANGSCLQPDGYESPEVSCDSRDNNCNGVVDEGCVCNEGTEESCYRGPSNTKGTGICSSGTRTCKSDNTWGSCKGGVVPEPSERCDGRDADCDGTVDEGCPCDYRGSSDGVCAGSSIDGSGSCTEPGAFETDESTCDGLDNDCDGVVDEGCSCDYDGSSMGVCPDGTIDTTGTCTAPSSWSSDETVCDDLDNDCDGSTDEGCDDDSDGWCDASRTVSGTPSTCPNGGGDCDDGAVAVHPGATEVCSDGIDNDCDGKADCESSACDGVACDGSGTSCRSGDAVCHETDCDDNFDNDGDGDTDCEDIDCDGKKCANGGRFCTNRKCTKGN